MIQRRRMSETDRAALLDRVSKQLKRAHDRTLAVPLRVIEREVRDALSEDRARRQK